jgi:hypothetical protein
MNQEPLSRRAALGAGVCALAAVAAVPESAMAMTESGLDPKVEAVVRSWYAGWAEKNWQPMDAMLASDFTFTSPNGDDHISKSAFKTRCWDSQIDFIDHFEIERLNGKDDEAFVLYVCRTKNATAIRNVEFLKLRDSQLVSIECYFGAPSNFASAVSAVRR